MGSLRRAMKWQLFPMWLWIMTLVFLFLCGINVCIAKSVFKLTYPNITLTDYTGTYDQKQEKTGALGGECNKDGKRLEFQIKKDEYRIVLPDCEPYLKF